MKTVKSYARFFAALADENRLRLLHLMRHGEICVCFLQGVLKTNQPKISRHLAYLRRAGLVKTRRQGKWMHYSLQKQPDQFQRILHAALTAIQPEKQIRHDRQRAKQITCAPTRYQVPLPLSGSSDLSRFPHPTLPGSRATIPPS